MVEASSAAKLRRAPAALTAAVALSLSALFAGVPVGSAEPYGDDDGGSSYSGGGLQESPAGGGMQQEPGGGGMNTEPGGGMNTEPGGGGMNTEPGGGGMQEEPGGGGMNPEPGGGGMQEEPGGGGMNPEPGGGMNTEPGGGGMNTEPGGGGMNTEPGGGGMNTEPGGGGMNTEPGGGGMDTGSGGGMATPAQLQATSQDVTTATKTAATQLTTETATTESVTSYYESIEQTFTSSSYSTTSTLSSPISQWNSNWIGYDRFYRPVFTNPYPNPMQVVYDYGGRPQTFTVPPLQRAVVDVPNSGVYNFTTLTRPASGPPTNVSVGSFSGGGYVPGPGQAPPQPPPAVKSIKNALVQVKFAKGVSDPFRVASLTDLGADPSLNNAEKVLLDGEVPAWGEWAKDTKGEDMFEITETQLMPGLKPPAQEPLPGYKVRLVSSQQPISWVEANKTLLISVGAGAGILALAGVGLALVRRRRTAD